MLQICETITGDAIRITIFGEKKVAERSLKPKKGDLRTLIPIIDYSVGLDSILNSTRFLFDDFLLLDEQQPPNDLTQSDVERCYFDALRLQLKYKN